MGPVVALGMTGNVSFGQVPVEVETYVSRGLNFKKDWGTFRFAFGDGGTATYLMGGVAMNVRLEFGGEFQSQDQPWVHYWIFREVPRNPNDKIRQWAFQIDNPGLNGFVIYYKDDQTDPFIAAGWKIYDFAP
jgi:hypothetical protein